MTMQAGSTKILVPVVLCSTSYFHCEYVLVEKDNKKKAILLIFIWSFMFSEGPVYLIMDEG